MKTFCILQEKFKIELSLFSVCMHFLRCIRSCDSVPNSPSHCKLCSRVEDFNFNCVSSFQKIQKRSDNTTLLGLNSNFLCNLDVFVSNAADYHKFFKVVSHFCSCFALFSDPEDVFAAFSSILMRIYLNVSFKVFSFLDLSLFDRARIREIIMTQSRFSLAGFRHEVNIDFFYEFFDKFDQYNLSYCFKNSPKQPKFGPYYPTAFDTTFTVIRL